jgi:hypothetical protein
MGVYRILFNVMSSHCVSLFLFVLLGKYYYIPNNFTSVVFPPRKMTTDWQLNDDTVYDCIIPVKKRDQSAIHRRSTNNNDVFLRRVPKYSIFRIQNYL